MFDRFKDTEGLMYVVVKAIRDLAVAFGAATAWDTDLTPGLDTAGAALVFAIGTTAYRLIREFGFGKSEEA